MGSTELTIWRFALIYLLLLVVLGIMKKCRMSQTGMLVMSSIRMTLQLVIAGLVLDYIFKLDSPIFTFSYLGIMTAFTIHRVLSRNKWLNTKTKWIIALSVIIADYLVIGYFITVVVGEKIWNPQYVISIGGMVMGNTMTSLTLALKSFKEALTGERARINALMCVAAPARNILLPCIRQALETAILPTINGMLGMGIVHLPGMMTGQILAGAVPFQAILYQIAIQIAICTGNVLACFITLWFGHQTLYDKDTQVIDLSFLEEK